jgi:F-type H+-transporting ATPase subunit delta
VSEEQVARVYARALFDAARDADAVDPVRRELGEFVAALAASASLRDVLADPQVETAAKQRVLVELTRGGQPLLANVLRLLIDRGRFAVVPAMYSVFDDLADAEEGVVEVELVVAAELAPETEKKIAARVHEATGRRVELARRVDPEILGGLILRIGDVIVDGSVKGRIRQLRRRLATAEVRGDV